MGALDNFLSISKAEFERMSAEIDENSIKQAAALIVDAKKTGGRLHITGIGKPSHVATYVASLISSTGTPTYYLHGTELCCLFY